MARPRRRSPAISAASTTRPSSAASSTSSRACRNSGTAALRPGPRCRRAVAPVPGQPGASGVPVEKQGSLLPGPLKGFDTRNAPTGPLGPQKRPTR